MSRVTRSHTTLRAWACAFLSVAVVSATSPSAQGQKAPAIGDLLDAYARGDFAAAVRSGAALPDLAKWKDTYPAAARAWIHRSPSSDVAKRRLVAAGLVLEVTRERYERDAAIWTALSDVVEWACRELAQESTPPRGEQAWQRASVALGQRVQSNWWLAMAGGNHLEHAWRRYPHDPRLALASLAMATRQVDTDIKPREDRYLAGAKRLPTPMPSFGGAVTGIAPGAGSLPAPVLQSSDAVEPRQESRQAIVSFTRLLSDPEVGAEAEAHVSHLYLMLHEWPPALEHARASTRLARDARPRYLGFVMAGLALEQLDQRDEARAAYQQALEAIPNGQTAVLLLTALDRGVGASPQVAVSIQRSLAVPSHEDDPWRMYYYGDYFHWPTHIEQLHEALR